MKKILMTQNQLFVDDYKNDLTRELDNYFVYPVTERDMISTYIVSVNIDKKRKDLYNFQNIDIITYAIRIPGQTCGYIFCDTNNVILSAQLFLGVACGMDGAIYKSDAHTVLNKYIGYQIVFKQKKMKGG